jgi:predicted kinase
VTPRIILAVGLPGSGKSRYLESLGVNPISSDALRLQLADDETDQTIHSQVFAAIRYLLRKRIELHRPATYIDATNITRHDRRPFIKIARETGSGIEAIYFDTPLRICKARNAVRRRVVPESALDLMAAKLVPPSVDEGFNRVEVVRCLPENLPCESAD